MNTKKKLRKAAVSTIAAVTAIVVSGAWAQETVMAYVPFVVNVNATITARQGGDVIPPMTAEAGKEATIAIPLKITSIIRHPQITVNAAPLITVNPRGNVSIYLPDQTCRNAELSLYTVNGKRVLHGKVSAINAASTSITHSNVAAGAYLLSVKGINGSSSSTRLVHRGGSININTISGSENISAASPTPIALAKAAAVDWMIIVSAAGYIDSSYALKVVEGINPVQNITLKAVSTGSGQFTDSRDGKSYRYVRIGNLTWMAENLNYTTVNSWCGDDQSYNCALYGRLYTWDAAMNACPAGWRLSAREDWDDLVQAAGGSSVAGEKLKSKTGWNYAWGGYSGNGTDEFGFSALPGGVRNPTDGLFFFEGESGIWWNAMENGSNNAYLRSMYYLDASVNENNRSKSNGYSVRCVKN